jgi:hypothetical protein
MGRFQVHHLPSREERDAVPPGGDITPAQLVEAL